MFSLEGKQAIVTGAGRGIGRAIALAFAAQGANVALAARSREQLAQVAEEVRALGRQAWVLPADLSDLEQARRLIDDAHAALGRIDILVNNAGGGSSVPGAIGPIEAATPEAFEAIYALNLRSPFFATLRAVERMVEQGDGGVILNTVSIDGLAPAPWEALYGSAKAALISLTAAMAVELGRHRIRVNALAPSLIDTPLVARHLTSAEQRANRASFFPINRVGRPEDIAAAAVYLCSDEAGWVSGETLRIAGGQKIPFELVRWVREHNPVPDGFRL